METRRSFPFERRLDVDSLPSNWKSHLKELDWKANLRALEIELKSPYNEGWWEVPTPEVIVEWPTMRKWASETLKDCLAPSSSRRNLSPTQQSDFLALFRACPLTNFRFVKFTEPTSSLVENIGSVVQTEQGHGENVVPQQGKGENDSHDGDDSYNEIWSLSAGNVNPLPIVRHEDMVDELEPIGQSAFEWEHPGLKSLDWRANLEALAQAMELPLNIDWHATETLYIKDPSLRRWANETMIQWIEESQSLTTVQRRDFLKLFQELPKSYLRSVAFLSPLSVVGNMEESDAVDTPNNREESDDDDSENSVYL